MNFRLLLLLLPLLCFTACDDDDDPEIINEEETINEVLLFLRSSAGAEIILEFEDVDGDGPMAPTFVAPPLLANETYVAEVQFNNTTSGTTEAITPEVREEDDEHQVFYATTVPGLTVAYTDTDDNGNPLGLMTTMTTGAAGTGTLTITLIHEPDKDAAGVSGGDPANAGGETDVEVTFNVTVQ